MKTMTHYAIPGSRPATEAAAGRRSSDPYQIRGPVPDAVRATGIGGMTFGKRARVRENALGQTDAVSELAAPSHGLAAEEEQHDRSSAHS
jgi:hypothetical protein